MARDIRRFKEPMGYSPRYFKRALCLVLKEPLNRRFRLAAIAIKFIVDLYQFADSFLSDTHSRRYRAHRRIS